MMPPGTSFARGHRTHRTHDEVPPRPVSAGKRSAVGQRYRGAPAGTAIVQAKSQASPTVANGNRRGQSRSDLQPYFDAMLGFPDDQAVQAIAALGVQGSGGSLPYLDVIQASFGRHDVTGVRAHVSGESATSAELIGAQAYTTGNHVAFASMPDLHTAAHEAAHVVQQRAGVHLKGGVGEVGDAYEQHADAVADLVVQGQSAESLLNAFATGGTSTKAVQRRNRVGLIDASTLRPRDRSKDIKLPTVKDPMVGLVDNDAEAGECRDVPRSEIVDSPDYVDAGLRLVDPRGDSWTLAIETLVFTNAQGRLFEVPWHQIHFGSGKIATSFEKSNGVMYPLRGDSGPRAFDRTNTPNIVKAAGLLQDLMDKAKGQRLSFAQIVAQFAIAIAGAAGPQVRSVSPPRPTRIPHGSATPRSGANKTSGQGTSATRDVAPSASGISVASSGGATAPMRVVRTVKKGEKLADIINEGKVLTFTTGNEHALVKLANGQRAIVSGGPGGITFKQGQVMKIFGHTHPTSAPPSAADVEALRQLGQSAQWVFHGGQVTKIRP